MPINNESAISKVTTIRLSNEAREQAEADYVKHGYRTMGEYLRAVIEAHLLHTGILCDPGPKVLAILEKRAKDKGWESLRGYCNSLLRGVALPDDYVTQPAKRRKK